jgi:predicted DNA-binding transcriptional regulator AlpA
LKIAEIMKLTKASKPTIYRWMERHPKIVDGDTNSLLGHPFPKPIKKEGRVVLWDEPTVRAWWQANASTVRRHSTEKPSVVLPWRSFREVWLTLPVTSPNTEAEDDQADDDLELIQRFERQGDDVQVWFSTLSDAVKFKLRYF